MTHVEPIPPHWTDDPVFDSEQQYMDYKAGLIPYPGRTESNPVFIGDEGKASVYVDRKDMTGVDEIMMRARIGREHDAKRSRALHELAKDDPGLIERVYAARWLQPYTPAKAKA